MATKPDDFDAAFASFSAPEPGPPANDAPAAPAGDPPADPPSEDPPAADQPAADPPAADPPAGDLPADPPAADPPAADPPAPPAPEGPNADAILEGLKKLVGNPPPAAPAPAAPAAEAPPLYNEEETEFLTQYEKDWGDVVRGEGLRRKAEYGALVDHIFQQVRAFVQPIRETAEVLAERTHASDVRTAVPDYSDNLRDEVSKWAEKQPTYLQVAYNHVITQGTVDEVKDLVARYREATGTKAPAPAPTPSAKTNELSGEAKKAALALAPVESQRSGVQAPGDPSNYDDAWSQFTKDA